jgi:hypothetical protein
VQDAGRGERAVDTDIERRGTSVYRRFDGLREFDAAV